MNEKLILEARDRIAANPSLIKMDRWVQRLVLRGEGRVDGAECNTAACIAGWIVTVDRKLRDPEAVAQRLDQDDEFDVEAEAIHVARLTGEESERLFYTWHWPEDLHAEYEAADTPEARADVVRRRIDLFVESRGTR